MTRRKEMEDCKDPAWLNSPRRAEIVKVLRDIEREERSRKKKGSRNGRHR